MTSLLLLLVLLLVSETRRGEGRGGRTKWAIPGAVGEPVLAAEARAEAGTEAETEAGTEAEAVIEAEAGTGKGTPAEVGRGEGDCLTSTAAL